MRFPPLFPKKCSDSVENFSNLPISGNFSSPYCSKFLPDFVEFTCFFHALCVFRFPPTLTMMHLCITQCTYPYCCLVYIPVLITQNRFLLTLDQLFSYLYIIKIDGEFK